MKPTIGRIVHYVLSEMDAEYRCAGEHRPAIIVKLWSDGCVQLQVFMDGTNDRMNGAGTLWVTSVHQDEADKKQRTWHWPEREEAP